MSEISMGETPIANRGHKGLETIIRDVARKDSMGRESESSPQESVLSQGAQDYIKSADTTTLGELKKLPSHRIRNVLQFTNRARLAMATATMLVAFGCGTGGTAENPSTPQPNIKDATPAVYELPTGMPSSMVELTNTSYPQPPESTSVKEVSVKHLKESAERDYNIQIVDPEEVKDFGKYGESKPVAWNEKTISGLTSSLDQLPIHFYQRPPKKEIRFQLWDAPGGSLSFCKTYRRGMNMNPNAVEKNIVILLSHKAFEGEYPSRPPLEITAHELSHCLTEEKEFNEVLKLLGFTKINEDTYHQKLGFAITDQVMRQSLGIDVVDTLEYGNSNIGEFIGVGSQFYVYGKERFLKLYGLTIGKEKAEKFYEFVKKDIFKGKEY